ncbi:hypothetical protein ACN2AU_09150 [Aerococcus viridans]
MKTSDVVRDLLRSNLTSYRIGKDTGVGATFIDNYRTHKTKIENMSLEKAELLEDYYYNEAIDLIAEKEREEISEYLNNYEKTRSTEMDEKFNMFKSDVSSIAQEYRKNEAYIYTKKEFLEFIQQLIEEAEDEDIRETIEEKYAEIEEINFNVVVNTINNHNYFI